MKALQDPNLWIEQGRWFQSPFANIFFPYWSKTKIVKEIVPELQFHPVFAVDGYAFKRKEDQENLFNYLKSHYEQGTLDTVSKTIDIHGKKIFDQMEVALKQEPKQLSANIEGVIELYKEFSGFWSIEVYMGDLLTRLAKEVGYVESEADLFAKVHPYLRVSWIEREADVVTHIATMLLKKYEDFDLLTLPELIENDVEVKAFFDQYLQEYGWVLINKWAGEPITKEHGLKRVAEEIQNHKQGNHIEKIRSQVDETTLDGIIQLSLSTSYWRAECARIENMTALAFREIFTDVAIKNDITYKEVLLLLPSEFVQTYKTESKKIDNLPKILARKKEYFSGLIDDKEVILSPLDPEYFEIKSKFVKEVEHSTRPSVLKGVGASPGNAEGVVRVIETQDQFADFKEGEILVSAETTPSFVPLMRLASAIVTGKGGITSHAAIVSRELKKPCVIAVKDVTKILKTGDRVTVDALKGIITILQ